MLLPGFHRPSELDQVLQDCGFVKIQMGDRWIWIADFTPQPGVEYHTLKVGVSVDLDAKPFAPADPREVTIQNVIPWMIRVDPRGQALSR